MKTKIILLLFLGGMLYGCRSVDKYRKEYQRSYVLQYYELRGISLYGNNGQSLLLYATPDYGEKYDRNSNSEIYDQMCMNHGDLNYNKLIYVLHGDEYKFYMNKFLANDFSSVNIVSDTDYDEVHMAGSSLNDLFRFISLSSYRFIRNGYTEYTWKDTEEKNLFMKYFPYTITEDGINLSTSQIGGFYPLNKLVSELEPDDLKVFGPGYMGKYDQNGDPLAVLLFETPPTLSKTHTFTVTMTADDGKVFSNSITMTFE